MSNIKDYHKTTEKLQSLVDKLGKTNTIKTLSTNYRQVQAILDSKKKFVSKKVVDKIDNLYAEVYNGGIETFGSAPLYKTHPKGAVWVDDIDNLNSISIELEKDFKKHLLKAEDKMLSIYVDKEYNKKVIMLHNKIDRLWTVIFALCMLLIILSGMIINLA